MNPRREILLYVVRFCRASGLSEAQFGQQAVRDNRFVRRLREGASPTLHTIERALDYIEAWEAERASERPARQKRDVSVPCSDEPACAEAGAP